LAGHPGEVLAVGWSPDGTRLAGGGADGVVQVWEAAGGGPVVELAGHPGGVLAVGWSPDGTRLASGGDDGLVRVVEVSPPRRAARPRRLIRWRSEGSWGGHVQRVVDLGALVASLSWGPDGRIAAGLATGCVALIPADSDDPESIVRLVGLADGGWAELEGSMRYRLVGRPDGRFWWTSGMCRFEPGELDGLGALGTTRLPVGE
jgi:WD40 repeat protein